VKNYDVVGSSMCLQFGITVRKTVGQIDRTWAIGKTGFMFAKITRPF